MRMRIRIWNLETFLTLDPVFGIRDGKNSDPGQISRIRSTGHMITNRHTVRTPEVVPTERTHTGCNKIPVIRQ